jgi:transcriptional regulator with XRE-family HTH domain
MITKADKKTLKKMGAQFRSIRESIPLSTRELGYLSGIDYSKISKIEKGEINITLTTLWSLCKGLQVEPQDLFHYNYE